MANVDRTNQYLKVTNPTTEAFFVSAKGANSVAITSLTAGDYEAGTYKAFYDSTADKSASPTASDQVDVPAFTIPAATQSANGGSN